MFTITQSEQEIDCQKSNFQTKLEKQDSKGRWTKEEHQLFLKGYDLYGKNWKKIEELIQTRNGAQIRSHAQKHFLKKRNEIQSKTKPCKTVKKEVNKLQETISNTTQDTITTTPPTSWQLNLQFQFEDCQSYFYVESNKYNRFIQPT